MEKLKEIVEPQPVVGLESVKKFLPENLLGKIKMGMSEMQIKKFVLNDNEFPTPFSKYRQAKLELWTRYNNIVNDLFEVEKLYAEIDLNSALIEEFNLVNTKKSIAEIKLYDIEIRKKGYSIAVIYKKVNEKLIEMKHFYDIYKKYNYFEKMNEEKLVKEEIILWIERAKNNVDLMKRHGSTIRKLIKEDR